MNTNHMPKYIVGAVLIVAIVGVLSLLMTGTSNNLTGQAVGDPLCTDTDGPVGAGGLVYTTQGTISGGTWKTTGATYADKTDSCVTSGRKAGYLLEGFCPDSTHGFYNYVNCATKVGAGYVCISGACVLDSDSDGVADADDVCPGYDDSDDADGDGTPDGCDTATDSDGDGVADTDDVCEGYDDSVDTDSDGTPDGCDADDDEDGYSDADEATAGTDSFDASDYPVSYPDLVIDESQTTVYVQGTVWIANVNGSVINNSANATLNLGIANQGTAAASGTSYNRAYLLDSSGAYVASLSFNADTLSIAPSATQVVSGADRTPLGSSATASFLQDIYDGGSPTVTVSYTLDYASTRYITESDETNNAGTYDITLDSSMYDIDFICIEYVSSGSTTYTTVVETTCT